MENTQVRFLSSRSIRLAAMAVVMCVLSACGKGPKSPFEPEPEASTSPDVTVSITPTTVTPANTATASATGGTGSITWSIVSGPGTVNSTSGVVTVSGAGTVVVRATDTKNKTADVNLTVVPLLAATAAQLEIVTGESSALTVTGGVPPLTASVVSGSVTATASSVTGGPAGAAVVRLTDALNNHVDLNFNVANVVTITPATKAVVASGTAMFSAAGGFTPYTYTVQSGGGSMSSSTYTAPATPGTATVRVSDRLGHSADSAVTIVGPVLIAPAAVTLAVLNTQTFSATGGLGPFTYAVISGSGSMTAASYMAPSSSGADTVQVTDSLGQTATATVTINPALSISPTTLTVAAGSTSSFTSADGVPPYSYSVQSGGGSIGSSTGSFVAPNAAATVVIRSTDARGNTAEASVTVMDPLLISPTSLTMTVGDTQTFSASQGQSPYTFSVQSGGGSIDPSTGVYSASSAGAIVVRVTDSLGGHADSNVTVLGVLTISPATPTLAVNNTVTFSVTGGLAPMAYTIESGGGTINASSGLYTAPSSSGSAVVRATDSLGHTSEATVTINPALAIDSATVALLVSQTKTFSASGGVSPYSYSVTSGAGSVDPSMGVYTAPATTGTDVVRVTDAYGNTSDSTITILPALLVSPATASVTVANTATFTASGGQSPYSYSVSSGTGTIDAAGVFTPTLPGSVTVTATDALGNTADAAVTVTAALAIAPASVNKLTNSSQTFTSSGGVGTITFSVTAGTGAINASSGVYSAPASPGTATVQVTDSIGNTATASVLIVDPLVISPATVSLAVNNTQTFSTVGGQMPYVYSIQSGGGSVDSSTGLFTAPVTSGTVVVRVTDGLGTTADATVTVNPALAISPATKNLVVNGTQTFTVVGGVAPYVYSVQSGGGSVNSSSGAFTAPATSGTVVVRVTDALSNTSDATVTVVDPIAISPATKTLAVNNTFTFTTTGGLAPYVYSIQSGGGSINSSSGLFTAPASAGTVVVRVTDAMSNTSDATVTVNAAVVISPATKTLAVNNTFTFTASGGVSPYAYSIQSGGGSVDSSTGLFTAPASAGTVVVKVTDALSNTSTATVTVNAALAISPATKTLAVNNTFTFTATGGVSPYTYSIQSGGGSVNSSSGLFTAPATTGTVTVRVTDSLSNTSDATVTINAALAISPSTKTLVVNNTQTFTATGGVSPYVYSIQSGGGSVNASTGLFTAPASAGTVTVRVTDAVSNTSDATVTVVAGLAISPATKTLAVNNTFTFTASGGQTPYVYSVQSGGGSINSSSGLFTAPATSGTVTVRVTDAMSNTSDATVTVNAALAISPATKTLAVNNTFTFTSTGGVAPYVYSIQSGGGSINSASGLFTAPATTGSVVVKVTDSLSNTSTATVTVNAALAISPATVTKVVSGTQTFTSTGGVSPYTYSIQSGGGSINSSSGAFTAPASAGTVIVKVTDSISNTSTSTVTVVAGLTISPTTKTLAVTNTFTFTGSGGSTPYVFSIQSGGGSINSSSGLFTAPASAGTVIVKITDAISNTATATVTVNAALAISPGPTTFAVTNGTKNFTATGGVSPFTYSIVSGGGSINASSGVLTAPSSTGSVVVKVTDSLSNTSQSTVDVVTPVAITPTTVNVQANDNETFTASGGLGPYSYLVVSGGGDVDPDTGEFSADAMAGTTVVRASDVYGNTADATITVYEGLTIDPATITVAPNSVTTFEGSGGLGALTYSRVSGTGTINSTSGDYTAPASAGSAVLRVTDSIGNTADAAVTVSSALTITPTTFKMATLNTKVFTSAGGVAPRTYSIVSGGGSIDSSTGTYTAGSSSGAVTVKVTDDIGTTATATITVVKPVKFYVGYYNNCMVYDDGSLRCFGDGGYGQLGAGSTADRGGAANQMGSVIPFIDLGTGKTVKDLSIGSGHICAILNDDTLKCWGLNTNGQLGIGTAVNRGTAAGQMGDSLPVVNVGSGRTVKKVFAGTAITCVILDNNATKCWGLNTYGTLGQGDKTSRGSTAGTTPDTIAAINLGTGKYAKTLALAQYSACAILNDDTIKCWGRNNKGQLLQGTAVDKGGLSGEMGDTLAVSNFGTGLTPSSIVGATNAFCALFTAGSVKCWGQGTNGVVGYGSTAAIGDSAGETGSGLAFTSLGTGVTATSIASGASSTTVCVTTNTNKIKCWGYNTYGNLGIGTAVSMGDGANEMGDNLPFPNLGTGVTVEAVGVGAVHSCMMTPAKQIKCWGRATNGATGNGTTSTTIGTTSGTMGDALPFLGM